MTLRRMHRKANRTARRKARHGDDDAAARWYDIAAELHYYRRLPAEMRQDYVREIRARYFEGDDIAASVYHVIKRVYEQNTHILETRQTTDQCI